ncbi:hypothetical protein FRC06_007090 [Ceratobasidium sp. 370]|nr:hypothetical protein FRC06_007090 [Ceratobasidium sp. 370]
MAPKAGLEFSRLDYLEAWLADHLSSSPSFHAKSGTLVGGWNGVVWIIRAILKVLANAGAVVSGLGVELGAPLPEGYDPCRLGLSNFEHVLEWAKKWTDVINSTIIVLELSHTEQWQPADFESESQPLAELNQLEPMYNEPRVASGSRLRRKSKRSPDHESEDGDEMDRLDAKAKCAWDKKSTSESEDWEGSKVTESVGSDSDSGLEPVVRKDKAPVRGEKLPAKVGGGSSGTKVEARAKTQAQMSGKSNPNQLTAMPANDPTPRRNPQPGPALSPKWKKEAQAWLMRGEWVQHASSEELARLESYVACWGDQELKWKEEAEQNAWTFQIHKANTLEAQRNGTIDEDIPKTTWTPAEHREIYDRVVANWKDKVAALWTEPKLSPVQKCIVGAERVPSLLNEFITAADEILVDWEAHYGDLAKPTFYLLQAVARLCEKLTDFPTLDFSIALHAAFWTQCQYANKDVNENVPTLHALHQDIQHELATSSAILRCINILERAEPLLRLPDGTKDQALEVTSCLRLLYNQIRDLKSLALSWRNCMKDCFRYLPTWFSIEELVDIGGMLEKWTEEASALYEKQDQESLEEWVKLGLSDCLRPQPCTFLCGNPLPYGFDKSAKGQ